jgi:hypothetical protein
MSNPFFAEFFGVGNLAEVQKYTQSEQTPYDDRMPETDHFENHPVGIRMFDKVSEPKPRRRPGRPKKVRDTSNMGRRPIPFTKKELRMIELRGMGYPRAKIAKRLGVPFEHVERILNRVNWKASKQRRLKEAGDKP